MSMVERHRRIDTFVWGLMPKWRASRGAATPLINARAESVAEKPSFRNLVPGNRCVIPMTGYYEWLTAKEAKRKIPYFIRRADGAPVAAAGLFDIADDQSGGYPRACIITVAANQRLAEVHDRMPAVLEGEALVAWLEGDTHEALSVLVPAHVDTLYATEVSTKVNSVRNNDASNIEPIESQLPRTLFEG
jgi:putative SOS response-associated peptidase YedK